MAVIASDGPLLHKDHLLSSHTANDATASDFQVDHPVSAMNAVLWRMVNSLSLLQSWHELQDG